MATNVKFINIVIAPPPDCLRCGLPTVWSGTPVRFKPNIAHVYSGTRSLCNSCYRLLLTTDRDALTDFPPTQRRSDDVYADYLVMKRRYPSWTKRQIAVELLGMSPTALAQAINRTRRRLRNGERIAALEALEMIGLVA